MVRVFFGVALVMVMVPLDRWSRIEVPVVASRMGSEPSFALLFRLRRVVDEQRVEHWQNEQSSRLTGQQTAEDRPGQRGVGLAAALERQRARDEREEGRQGRHRDRPDPQAGRLADGLDRRQALMASELLAQSVIRTELATLMPTMKMKPSSDWTLTADLVRRSIGMMPIKQSGTINMTVKGTRNERSSPTIRK